jgi:trehalose 6-phosphate phosphatase
VHVRQVDDRAAAAAVLDRARALADPSSTVKPGKDVLEVAVTDADKGSALRRLRADVGAVAARYMGDDVTDEDGFRALEPDDVTIKVGPGETAARYRVPDTAGALEALRRLADRLG